MYVCLCHGITDEEIRQLIADGKACAACIGNACGAGTCCGACVEMIDDMIDQHAAARCQPRQDTTATDATNAAVA